MLEFGQPLHFFDKNRLGNHILVRDAKDKEEVITLDGKRRILSSNDIVITDGNRPVCIAGVMGGENTEVEQDTTDILIEAAIFGATILSGCIRHDVIDKTPKVVEFVPEDVNKLLGITITVDDMKVELKR